FSGRRAVENAAGSTGSDVSGAIITGLQFLLVGGIVYQVLQPKGANALSGILSSGLSIVDRIVKPIDPFTKTAPAAAAGPAPVLSTQTGPASSVSGPGTAAHPNMFQDPFARFPAIHSPLLATGAPGSHVKQPSSPLAIGGP
ncbi:MAG: hypothetical protein ACRDZY_12255, partial [Acidimicrobiales bacterium]